MTTTQHPTVDTARRAADSPLASYGDRVADVEQHRRAARDAQSKMARATKTFKDGQSEFAAAIYGLNQAGISGGQIAREFEISETHARNIIRYEKLRRSAAG